MTRFHLAQFNIARTFAASVEDPILADFVARLDDVNALAEASPGFVWRLQDESGNAASIDAFDDPRTIINLSVRDSLEALFAFAYQSGHAKVLARRKEWFVKLDGPHMVLWGVPAGHLPSLEEAKARLDRLAAEGPGPDAFTFKERFVAPAAVA